MPYSFEFLVDNNVTFQCALQSQKCIETSKQTGIMCKRTTIIGTPYCWTHLLYKKRLRIKPSTIPAAGNGLFAQNTIRPGNDPPTIIFKKNDTIIEYKGERINLNRLNQRYDTHSDKGRTIKHTAPYGMSITNDLYIDSACKRGVGSLANHKSRKDANAEIKYIYAVNENNRRGPKVGIKIVALRDIKNGEEIFISYGRSYKRKKNETHRTRKKR